MDSESLQIRNCSCRCRPRAHTHTETQTQTQRQSTSNDASPHPSSPAPNAFRSGRRCSPQSVRPEDTPCQLAAAFGASITQNTQIYHAALGGEYSAMCILYTYIYIYVCVCVCMHACMHACMHVCMYICEYTYSSLSIYRFILYVCISLIYLFMVYMFDF